jgi:group II intron reverse transcriptase/maturase
MFCNGTGAKGFNCFVVKISQPVMGGALKMTTKSFAISKAMVWQAYKRVRAKGGAAGIDDQSIEAFEMDLKNNLYKLWNRMASGSYFPPAVKRVEIPKADGGKRPLGIPTVSDRIAQMVVKEAFEPEVEKYFHEDSYGYRPEKTAYQAVGVARQRCWRNDFVLDVDIKGFFDTIDHEMLMKAVRKHSECKWVILYIERWLKAPVKREDGQLENRDKGTPQGGVISPLLANLYLHYVFDIWMNKYYPGIQFERYADDIVIHMKNEGQAKIFRKCLEERFAKCKLVLHPEKTKIVYCKDDDRTAKYPNTSFTFLGYEFRPRGAKNKYGKLFCNFLPAVSRRALTRMKRTVRAWKLQRGTEKSLEDLSRMFNPIVRGWIQYYGKYYKSALFPLADQINRRLAKWVENKYKKFRRRPKQAKYTLGRMARNKKGLFAHWSILGYLPADGTKRAV